MIYKSPAHMITPESKFKINVTEYLGKTYYAIYAVSNTHPDIYSGVTFDNYTDAEDFCNRKKRPLALVEEDKEYFRTSREKMRT